MRNFAMTLLTFMLLIVKSPQRAFADEGGASFWQLGQFGSLVAVPNRAGWALTIAYYHSSADTNAGRSFRRGRQIIAGLDARSNLLSTELAYTFSNSVAGAHAAIGLNVNAGPANAAVDAILTGPEGGILSGARSQTVVGIGDPNPSATLKWSRGDNNFMTYTMVGVPVGSYSADRIANLGLNHWSLDSGGAYTFFDKRNEFSAIAGFTYNFENRDTLYQNGINSHLDWSLSRFTSDQTNVGLAGYSYYQLTRDSGGGAVLGEFKSRVSAVGPQVGRSFGKGDKTWSISLRSYYEFTARNRPRGWNVWLTYAIP
jgi:hypothetical protein